MAAKQTDIKTQSCPAQVAKLCAGMEVETQLRGYWSEFQAGHQVFTPKLREPQNGAPSYCMVAVTPSQKQVLAPVNLKVDLDGPLHRVVQGWLIAHREAQKSAKQDVRDAEARFRETGSSWDLAIARLVPDPTPRDQYRFKATSALLKAAASIGASELWGEVEGKIGFVFDEQEFEIVVKEKLRASTRRQENDVWTAFKQHPSHTPTGWLRVEVSRPHYRNYQHRWLESEKLPFDWIVRELCAVLGAVASSKRQSRLEAEIKRAKHAELAERRAYRRGLLERRDALLSKLSEISDKRKKLKELKELLDQVESGPSPNSLNVEFPMASACIAETFDISSLQALVIDIHTELENILSELANFKVDADKL